MKSSLPVLALLLAGLLAPSPARAQEVTFKKAALAVGDSCAESSRSESDVEVSFSNNGQLLQTMKQTGDERQEKSIEVLAVTEGKASKFKVRYKTLKRVQETPMTGREEKIDPLHGKTFILEKSGEAVAVTDEAGAKVKDGTAQSVRVKEARLFGDDPLRFARALPDRPIKVGEAIRVDKDKASAIFMEDGVASFKVSSMTLKLKETRERDGVRVGVFAVAVKGQVEPQGARGSTITLELDGELELGVENSWPYRLELSGPLGFTQSQGPTTVTGKGTSRMTVTATYKRKATAAGG